VYFLSEEHSNDYANYKFAYTRYAILEDPAELDQIYPLGYLPYSADVAEAIHRFYMARSLRFTLSELQIDKKRRHLQRQIATSAIQTRILDRRQLMEHCDEQWQARVISWMEKRFDKAYLSSDRLKYILSKPFANRLMSIELNERPFADILLCCGQESAHYWFAFYNPHSKACDSTGKWLISHFLEWAKTENFKYAYLGTAYAETSAYKFQGLSPIEFWDGTQWNPNKEELKKRLDQSGAKHHRKT